MRRILVATLLSSLTLTASAATGKPASDAAGFSRHHGRDRAPHGGDDQILYRLRPAVFEPRGAATPARRAFERPENHTLSRCVGNLTGAERHRLGRAGDAAGRHQERWLGPSDGPLHLTEHPIREAFVSVRHFELDRHRPRLDVHRSRHPRDRPGELLPGVSGNGERHDGAVPDPGQVGLRDRHHEAQAAVLQPSPVAPPRRR